MQSKKLGRAAAAACLMALLLPGVAAASWWDGGSDGRYDSGFGGRRGNDSGYEQPPESDTAPDYESPGETPPPDDNPPPQDCGQSGCRQYTPPPDDNPPPQDCGQTGCRQYTPPPDDNPPPQDCGQTGCRQYTPPPDDNPPPQDCGQSGCRQYTPPPQECGQSGCRQYTPPPQECGQPDCAPPPEYSPPPQCGQPDCGPPPPQCGQPACSQAPPPPPPPPPPYLVGPIYGCENSDLAEPYLALHKTTTPPPGTPVRPGDEILIDLTWRVWDWMGPELHKVIDCVYINGLFVPELSGGERLTPNDGHFGFHYFVPLDVPPGSEICDQGFVSGPNGWEEYERAVSNVVCFPVDLPPPPPSPSCCVPPPVETTTTTAPEEAQPYTETESERISQEVPETPPAEALMPAAHEVLPRTGSGPGAARLAAAGLALATVIRRRTRRR